jgi:membrane-bound acyltransferase YfiQ involved in biofilm formation
MKKKQKLKKKWIAVLLAALFGAITYVYTWNKDYQKFGIFLVIYILSIVYLSDVIHYYFIFILQAIILIHIIFRKSLWYKNYYKD